MTTKKDRQANLFPVDIETVWSTFLAGCDWEKVDPAEEKDALSRTLAQVDREIRLLQARRVAIIAQIESPKERKARARRHLEDAAKQMGPFGTEAVLLASLTEAFPQTLYERTLVSVSAGAEAQQGPSEPAEAPKVARPAKPNGLESLVLEVLDYEGMTSGEILKLVRKHPGLGETTSRELAKATESLSKQKRIEISGERRAKTYKLSAAIGG
jgi:hypothetical protein